MKERHVGMIALFAFGLSAIEIGTSGFHNVFAAICMLINAMILGGIIWSKRNPHEELKGERDG